MADQGRDWVRQQLPRPASLFGAGRPWRLFEATPEIYAMLENGDDAGLQLLVDEIAYHFLRLPSVPVARYEWGLRMAPHVAGEIRIVCEGGGSLIRVPFFYLGRPYAVGAIIAHELSHQLLAGEGIWDEDVEANERLTDLTAVVAGMGKLLLNGLSAEAFDRPGVSMRLGYLEPELVLYAYDLVNRLQGVGSEAASRHLLPDVASRLNEVRLSAS